jgi:PqqD family protein of HPr-rel-A system
MAGSSYIADPDVLAVTAELEGLTLLFDPRSGQTHMLAPPAPQILEALAGRAGDARDVLDRIGERFDLASDAPAAAIAARLTELAAAGLVRRP